MTNQVTSTPTTVDYTNRDFYSLREALIARVQARVPNWSGTDSSDFGVALIEAFSYMGDVVGYYTDRIANEGNIVTATQRDSVLAIAKSYGYTPAGYQAASNTLQFSNTSASSITVHAGTELYASVSIGDSVQQIIFTTSADCVVPAAAGTTPGVASVSASHGEQVALRPVSTIYNANGELLGYSDGTANQSFTLKSNQVVDGSVSLLVKNGTAFSTWSVAQHLSDFGPADAVYSVSSDANNYVTVTFGDGVSGAVPPIHSEIRAQYVVGGGAVGNLPSNLPFSFYIFPSTATTLEQNNSKMYLSVISTTAAQGGIDPVSTDMVRYLAPQALSALNRAVSLSDYASLAMSVPTVGAANSVAEIWSSVTIYAAPLRAPGAAEQFPLYDDTNANLLTTEWTPFQQSVQAALSGKTQIGVTTTVAPPKYAPVDVTIRYTKLPAFTDTQVVASIRSYMETYYAYSYRTFGETIHPSDIESLLSFVPGVSNVHVDYLYRDSDLTPTRSILVGKPNEIFIFGSLNGTTSRTTINATSTSASLSSLVLTPTGGTVSGSSPAAFNSAFYNYAYALTAPSTSVTITPTSPSTTATITVNGVAVTSGSPSASITLGASGGAPTIITIVVTAQDGITTATYTLSVSH